MELTQYSVSLSWKVDKQSDGSYVVHREDYRLGEKVAEFTYNFDNIGGGDEDTDGIIGVYQKLHSSTYLTDTSVVDAPLNLNDNDGYRNAFANCSAITSIDLSTDTSYFGTPRDNEYAFYGCSSLQSINIGDKFSVNIGVGPSSASSINYSHMFDGCTSLTSIEGTIGFNGANPAMIVDMFKGCSNLKCSNLTIYNGPSDSIYDLFYKHSSGTSIEVDGETRNYTYSYELLGLTLAQLKQATVLDNDNGSKLNLDLLIK